MRMPPGYACSHFFSYLAASSGAMTLSMSICVLSTTGNLLVICSSFASASTRFSHVSLTVGISFYMRPLHRLAETLITQEKIRETIRVASAAEGAVLPLQFLHHFPESSEAIP